MRFTRARVLACIALAGCTKLGTANDTGGGGRHPWTHPHELRVGSQVEPNTLDPLLAADTTEDNIDHLMFDNLVSVDEHGHDVPMLAREVPTLENGGISKDGLTITYHLRPGLTWSDGVALTSADVKFSYTALMNPKNNIVDHNGYDLVSSVDTPDPATAVFHMKRAFAPAVDTLFAESDNPYEVAPEHVLGKLATINDAAFNASPVTSGPFVFKEWIRGDHLTLAPNPHYFLGAPKLQSLTIRFIPDENTEVNALRTHDIDWQFEASPLEYRQVRQMSGIKIVLQDRNEYERVIMNTRHAPLDDVRVRQAIAYAVDRAKLTSELTGGSGVTADQDHPPFMWAHSADVTTYHVDLGRARALLASAGFAPGPDGVMTRAGQRLALTIVYNTSNATRRNAVVQVQAMLRRIGIDAQPKAYPGSLLFAAAGEGGILNGGKFDLAWVAWVAGADPDNSSLYACADLPPSGENDSFYCNPTIDAGEAAAIANLERAARKNAYDRIEHAVTGNVPELAIWWPRQIQPINPDFVNFSPNAVTETWNAYAWDI